MGAPVLVIDDNAHNLKLLRVLLSVDGYDVRTATDAEDALRVLGTFTPEVILMDLQLPGMDGLELTRQLKADPQTRRIRIIAVTAYAMKGDDEKARAAGCDDYVSKPVDADTLSTVVARHIGR
jgi:CheY-like chemotaxis protein